MNDSTTNDPAAQRTINSPDFIAKNAEGDLTPEEFRKCVRKRLESEIARAEKHLVNVCMELENGDVGLINKQNRYGAKTTLGKCQVCGTRVNLIYDPQTPVLHRDGKRYEYPADSPLHDGESPYCIFRCGNCGGVIDDNWQPINWQEISESPPSDPAVQRMTNAPDFIEKNAERDLAEALHDQDQYKNWAHDGDLAYIQGYIVWCARAWDPHARLLGNARAGDIANAVSELIKERNELRKDLTNSVENANYVAMELLKAEEERDRLKAALKKARAFVAKAEDDGLAAIYEDNGQVYRTTLVRLEIEEVLK